MIEDRYLEYWAGKARDPQEFYRSMSAGAMSNVSEQACYDAWNRAHPLYAAQQPPERKAWWE